MVINKDPAKEPFLLLVCSTSQIEKAIERRRNIANTLVKIGKTEYPTFTTESIVDCNNVFKKTVEEIITRLQSKKLKLKPEMPIEIVNKLRKAVIASPVVENLIKKMLKA